MLDQVSLVRRRVRELPERGLMPRFDISEPGPDQFKVRSWRDWISERASAVLKYSYIGIAVSFVYAVLFNLGNFYFIDINTIWLLTPADYVSSAVSALSLLAVALLVVAAFLVVYVSVLVGIYIVVRILGYAISAAWSRLFSRRGQDETPASQRKTRAWINKLAFIFVVLYVFLLSAAFEYFLGYKLALGLLSGRVPTNALGFFALFVECAALFLPTIFLLFYVVWIVPECLEGKISDSQALVARIIPSVILSTLLTLLLVMPIYGAGTLFSKLNELDSGYIRCEPINGSARIPGACFVRAIERGQFMYDPEKMVILFLPRDGLPQLKFPLRINPPEFWVDLPIVDMALATLPRMHRKVHLMVDNSTAADSWTTATLSGVSRLKAVPDAVTPAERVVRGLAFSGEPRAAFAYALGLFANRYRGQAMYFMKAAADKGFAPAATRLAIWLEEGDGVAQDINAGTRYLGIGAKGGNTFAMDWLADHYLNGSGGVARNPEQALYWYTMAAERGFTPAQLNLVRILADPRKFGLPADDQQKYERQAYFWAAVASIHARYQAAVDNSRLGERLSNEQKAEIAKQAEAWKPQKLDIIACGGFSTEPEAFLSPDEQPPLRPDQIIDIRERLKAAGYMSAPVTGDIDDALVSAIRAFENDYKLPVTGRADLNLEAALWVLPP